MFMAVFTGCSEPAADRNVSYETSVSSDSPPDVPGAEPFDLKKISDASKVSLLISKYDCINVNYNMDYGEPYTQNMTFFSGDDGGIRFVGEFGTDREYYIGNADYWEETTEDGVEGYAYLALDGARIEMDLEGYVFSYGDGDGLKADNYTRSDDGGYIIEASEQVNSSDGSTGETVSYRYEYMLAATKDCELVQMKCSCTDTSTGEVDSTLDMKVDYGVKKPDIPEFMDNVYELTTITVRTDGTENTEKFDIPEGFMPYLVTPGGSCVFSYDKECTRVIEDTFSISGPCTIYAVMQEQTDEKQ